MIAGDDGDASGIDPEVFDEHVPRELELALEREVRQVARHDDVVDPCGRDLARDGPHVRGPVHVPALEPQVRPSGQALVEEAPHRHAVERQEMEVREVRDSHGQPASAAHRKPIHAGRDSDVVSRDADRTQTAPSSYEPPRITWNPPPPVRGLGSTSGPGA